MNSITNKIINEIQGNGLEIEIYNILHDIILNSYKNEVSKYHEKSASLQAIKKINQGKNKAIDALCEEED